MIRIAGEILSCPPRHIPTVTISSIHHSWSSSISSPFNAINAIPINSEVKEEVMKSC